MNASLSHIRNEKFTYEVSYVPFAPTDLPNLQLWLDATDLSTITKDGGNAVSSWADKSGNGYHVINDTAIKQPIYNSTGFGTQSTPYINFDGIDDTLLNALMEWGDGANVFIVATMNDNLGASQMLVASGGASQQIFVTVNDIGIYNGSVLYGDSMVVGTSFALNVLLKGANSIIKVNDNANTNGSDGTSFDTTSFLVGQGPSVNPSNMKLTEIIVTDELTTLQRDDLIAYANAKYGIF